jgi:anaerobic selenocysteine-containing dehydrogenase
MATTQPSICRLCLAHCGILTETENGKITKVTGDPENPLFEGYTCPKGRALPEQHNHPDRLLHSVKRDNSGHHQKISSKDAVNDISKQLQTLIEKYGPRSVAMYIGTNSLPYPTSPAVANALLRAINSPMFFTANTIDQPNKQIAQALHGIWQAGDQNFNQADSWILVGVNPVISKAAGIPCQNPAQRLKEALQRGMKLIVIDPRKTETARKATIHLQARPGEDCTILAGLIHIIIKEQLYDQEFVKENVDGFEELKHSVADFDPASVANRAGIDIKLLTDAARLYANATSGAVNTGTGASFSMHSNLTEYLALSLTTLCGRWPKAGDTVTRPNAMMPSWTARAQATDPFQAWGFGEKLRVRNLSDAVCGLSTAALADEILLEGEGQVRALICIGGNPMTAWPDQLKTEAAMKKLDLLVTIDPFMSATAQLAHYVIAPKLTLETPGMSQPGETGKYYGTGMGIPCAYAQVTPAIVEPPAGSDLIEEWQLFHGIAKCLSLDLDIGVYYGFGPFMEAPPHDFVLDQKAQITTEELHKKLCQPARIPFEEIQAHPHGKIWPVDEQVQAKEPEHRGKLLLADKTMMEELIHFLKLDTSIDAEFPFRLISRRTNKLMNSSGHNIPKLKGDKAYNPAWMHADDLKTFDIKSGDSVVIRSRHNEIQAVAETDNTMRPGVISMNHAFGGLPEQEDQYRKIGSNTGKLLSVEVDYDPHSGMPRMGNLPVAICRLN